MPAPAHPPESPSIEPGSSPLVGAALAAGLVAAAIALALFVWLGYQIRSGSPTAFDLAGRNSLRSLQTDWLSTLMWAASVFAAPKYLLPLGIVAAVAFLLREWRRGAVLVLVTLMGAGVLDVGLKALFARARPEAVLRLLSRPELLQLPQRPFAVRHLLLRRHRSPAHPPAAKAGSRRFSCGWSRSS